MDAIEHIKNQIREAIPKKFKNLTELAAKAGVNQPNLSQFMDGKRASMKLETAWKILNTLHDQGRLKMIIRRTGDLSPVDVVEGPDLVAIPVYEQAGAGDEVDFFDPNPERMIKVLPRYALKNVCAIEVVGDSMEPVIKRGAFIGVVPLDDRLIEGQIYLVRRPNFGLVVKRVLMGSGGDIVLRSDNSAYPDQSVPNEGYEQIVVGKVVWVWQLV